MAIKPTKRALHSEEVRKNILTAAEQLFRQYGYDTVSMKDIAAAVDATTGTLYHHFKSKEDILANIPHMADSSIETRIENYPASEHPLDDMMDFYINVMTRRVLQDGLQFTQHRVFHVLKMDHAGIIDRTTKQLVIRAQQLGQLRKDRTPEELTDFFVSVFRGAVYYYTVSSVEVDLEQMVRTRLTLAIEGGRPQ